MLEKLILKNFQAHAKLKLDLDPHVTTLVGPSDSGKSAVMRALRWLCQNTPQGTAFIRDGEKTATVQLWVDGHRIKRSRGSKNTYQLDGQNLLAFKSDVPEPVAKLLNVSDINFQSQLDPVFWFSLSPGEVSRQLNQIINLGVIDSTLARLNSQLRESTARIAVCRERKAAAKTKKASLANAVPMDRDLTHVENLRQQARQLGDKAVLMGELVRKVAQYGSERKRALEAKQTAQETLAVVQDWADTEGRRNRIVILLTEARRLEKLTHCKVPDLGPVEKLCMEWQEAEGRRGGLDELLARLGDHEESWEEIGVELDQVTKAFEKGMGGTCALCGRPL